MLVRHDTNDCLTCKEKRQSKRFNLYNRKNIKEFIKRKEFNIILNGIDCFYAKGIVSTLLQKDMIKK